jgi:hypothetical protein
VLASTTTQTLIWYTDSMALSSETCKNAIEILEHYLPFVEERYLKSFYGEPWGPLTMSGAIMMLRMHVGRDTRLAAKSTCAQRSLDLYYKHFSRQDTCSIDMDDPAAETPSFPDAESQYMGYPELNTWYA